MAAMAFPPWSKKNTEHNQSLINAGGCETYEKNKNSAMLKNQTTQKKNDQVNTQVCGGMKEKRRSRQTIHDAADDYKPERHPVARGKKA